MASRGCREKEGRKRAGTAEGIEWRELGKMDFFKFTLVHGGYQGGGGWCYLLEQANVAPA